MEKIKNVKIDKNRKNKVAFYKLKSINLHELIYILTKQSDFLIDKIELINTCKKDEYYELNNNFINSPFAFKILCLNNFLNKVKVVCDKFILKGDFENNSFCIILNDSKYKIKKVEKRFLKYIKTYKNSIVHQMSSEIDQDLIINIYKHDKINSRNKVYDFIERIINYYMISLTQLNGYNYNDISMCKEINIPIQLDLLSSLVNDDTCEFIVMHGTYYLRPFILNFDLGKNDFKIKIKISAAKSDKYIVNDLECILRSFELGI